MKAVQHSSLVVYQNVTRTLTEDSWMDCVRDRLVVDENAQSQNDLEPRTKRAINEAMYVSLLSKGGRYEVPSAPGVANRGRRVIYMAAVVYVNDGW